MRGDLNFNVVPDETVIPLKLIFCSNTPLLIKIMLSPSINNFRLLVSDVEGAIVKLPKFVMFPFTCTSPVRLNLKFMFSSIIKSPVITRLFMPLPLYDLF